MKIASWNVNSLKVRLPHVQRWLGDHEPDVLGLQETKLIDENFPVEALADAGYQVAFSGQKTYNGVALLSREPAEDIVTDLPGLDDPQRRVLAGTVNGVRVINLYVPNGQALDSDKFQYKLGWLEALEAWLKDELARHDKLVVMGDFNIAHRDEDVHDPAAWAGKIHCSDIERGRLDDLLALGLVDTFRQFEQEEASFSWWDYRGGAFWRNEGLRIDYVFASEALAASCTAARIDKRVRMRKQPSDHAPVVAEFGA